MKRMFIKMERIDEANYLVEKAKEVNGDVILKRGKFSADAKSILGVMAINIQEGVTIEYPEDAINFEAYIKEFEVNNIAIERNIPLEEPIVEKISKPFSSYGFSINIEAPIDAKVFKLETSVGQKVKKGDEIIVIEAMKMEIPVVTPKDGIVTSINVKPGDIVKVGTIVATVN